MLSIKRIVDKEFVELKENYIVLDDGERVLLKRKGVTSITSSDSRLVILKNTCSFVIACPAGINCSLSILFKSGTIRSVGIYSSVNVVKKINFGVKTYIEKRTVEFLENNHVLLDSIYFTITTSSDSKFLENTLVHASKLGIKNIFYIYKVAEPDWVLILSSVVEFLNAMSHVNLKLFIILEEVIDTATKTIRYSLEDIHVLFKDKRLVPVFSLPFHPQKLQEFDTETEFLENLENLKKVFIEEVSFLKNFQYLLAYDVGSSGADGILTNDDWITYFFGIECINKETTRDDNIILYNIPCGHVVNSKEISRFSRKAYRNHTETSKDFSDSAGLFIFGGKGEYQEQKNFWKDILEPDGTVPSHLPLISNKGIRHLLFGAKEEDVDTECVPCKNNCYTFLDEKYILDSIQTNFFLKSKSIQWKKLSRQCVKN